MIDPTSRLPDLSLELGPTLSLDLPTVTRAVTDSLVTLLGSNGESTERSRSIGRRDVLLHNDPVRFSRSNGVAVSSQHSAKELDQGEIDEI